MAQKNNPVVQEYEVFRNAKDALAFFFYRQSTLDANAEAGPFWFTTQDDKRILAGTAANYAVFEGVDAGVLETAKKRGVIMLVEFENQQPVRCTPCYMSDKL